MQISLHILLGALLCAQLPVVASSDEKISYAQEATAVSNDLLDSILDTVDSFDLHEFRKIQKQAQPSVYRRCYETMYSWAAHMACRYYSYKAKLMVLMKYNQKKQN